MLELKNMIKPEQSAELDFPGYEGFTVTLNYLGREKLAEIRNKCVVKKVAKGQLEEAIDFDKFNKLYSAAVIKGWKGLKLKYLREMLLLEIPEGYNEESELPYTQENAEYLLKNANSFDVFVSATLSDLTNFTKHG